MEVYLRRPDVLQIIAVSKSTLHKWVAEGVFPKPIKIGARATAWRKSDLVKWQREKETGLSARDAA